MTTDAGLDDEEKASTALKESLIEEVFALSGGFGKFQWMAWAVLFATYIGSTFWWWNVQALILPPKYVCLY